MTPSNDLQGTLSIQKTPDDDSNRIIVTVVFDGPSRLDTINLLSNSSDVVKSTTFTLETQKQPDVNFTTVSISDIDDTPKVFNMLSLFRLYVLDIQN